MALLLKINAVDRSSYVKWNTLSKTEVLSKEVDRMEFEIAKLAGRTIPAIGQSVELLEDSIKIFGGVITEINEQIRGGILIGYRIRCKDWSQYLDRKLATKSYANQSAHSVFLDLIATYTTGFTTTHVNSGSPTLTSVKFNYEQITRCLTKIADLVGWDWYVDPDKDLHFFDSEQETAPFELSDTNDKYIWDSLELNQTILQIKNVVYVRGGEYKKTYLEDDAIDTYSAGAGQKTFGLAYKYDDITVKVDGVVQTIGTDQQDDPVGVDCLYNFSEKFITFTSPLSGGEEVIIFGDAFIPIIAQARDQVSIATYGVYETAVVDKNITSVAEAQLRARTELKKYSETVFEGSFKTTSTGLKTGQRIRIQSTIRGIDKTFKINRVVGKARSGNSMEYTIYLIASGQVSFTDVMVDLLERDKQNIVIAPNEVLQRVERFIEELAISDGSPSASSTSSPYTWGVSGSSDLAWNFGTWE